MSGYLLGWGSLLLRWLHLITGTAWIGSSFYFLWLDNPLLAPERPEATAYWFSWQAYSTWLSGVGLLGLLYFLHADAYLIDPAVRMLSPRLAVLIAVGILVGSWLAYEGLCRSKLRHSTVKLVIALALLAAILAWGVCALFSGRGAFIMFGAAIGTVMVANVLSAIVPGQRELVRARQEGREADPALGLRGRMRSIHNTYLTLPVLFVMISNHYAMTYSVHYNWLALIAMSFSGVCIRVWFVARHKPAGRVGFESLLPLIMGLLALVIVIIGLYPDCALPVCPQPPQG
ncbi:MAG TPA: urate hydroxylase PuuD [Steroidobacteraceae bacterium]